MSERRIYYICLLFIIKREIRNRKNERAVKRINAAAAAAAAIGRSNW